MRIKQIVKKLSAVLMSLMLLFGGTTTMVHALATPIIDESQKGSLTVYKYEGDSIPDLTGKSNAEKEQAIKDAGLSGLEGVTFHNIKVGDVKQVKLTSGAISIGYSLSSEMEEVLGLTDNDALVKESNVRYYSVKTLNTKIAEATSEEAISKLETIAKKGTKMPETNANGVTQQSEIELGLYLVAETGHPSNVSVKTNPFLVSIPQTSKDEEKNATWSYDIKVYPKNQTQEITIDKTIKDEGRKDSSSEIGLAKTFQILADIPAKITEMKTYKITDTLSNGLDFVEKTQKVYVVDNDGKEKLLNSTEYEFVLNGKNVIFNFTNKNSLNKYKKVMIEYDVVLNKDAVISSKANPNDVRLDYSKKTNVDHEEGTGDIETVKPIKTPKLHTYQVNLFKFGNGDETEKLAGVEFVLLNENKKEIKVSKNNDGVYYINANGTETLTTDSEGAIKVKGLSKGTYYVRETKTVDGYNLLHSDIKVKISDNAGEYDEDTNGTWVKVDTSYKYYADAKQKNQYVIPTSLNGKYVNFDSSNVYDQNGNKIQMVSPKTFSAQCEGLNMDTEGNITLKVNNNSGFELPETGGNGAVMFIIGAGLLIAAAAVVLYTGRKENKKNR